MNLNDAFVVSDFLTYLAKVTYRPDMNTKEYVKMRDSLMERLK